ncbi:hypothetical protein N7527_002759 [Penicillium freii]|nr:hypothetical protein N7527_002759 [Penicillium freii]
MCLALIQRNVLGEDISIRLNNHMCHAMICMALEKLMLTKKSGIIGFDSIFGPVNEGLGTEDVRESGVGDAFLNLAVETNMS